MSTDWNLLTAPFPAEDIEWRLQSAGEKNGRVWARVLAYITARAIQTRLDDVFGPGGWCNEYRPGPDGGVLCRIYFRNDDGAWVWREDVAENTDVEAVKGGASGALKRAGAALGIGRYLYKLDESFGNVHEGGKLRGKTKDGKPFKWDPPQLPAWALPGKSGAEGNGAGRSTAKKTSRTDKSSGTNGSSLAVVRQEHEAMLEFVKSVGPRVEDEREVEIAGKRQNLKTFIRENWGGMKEQVRLTRAVVQALEEATGVSFEREEA